MHPHTMCACGVCVCTESNLPSQARRLLEVFTTSDMYDSSTSPINTSVNNNYMGTKYDTSEK